MKHCIFKIDEREQMNNVVMPLDWEQVIFLFFILKCVERNKMQFRINMSREERPLSTFLESSNKFKNMLGSNEGIEEAKRFLTFPDVLRRNSLYFI